MYPSFVAGLWIFFLSPKNPRIKQKPPEKCPTSLLFFFGPKWWALQNDIWILDGSYWFTLLSYAYESTGNPQDANRQRFSQWFSVGFCGDMCHDFISYKPPFSSWFFSWISHKISIYFPWFSHIFTYFPMILHIFQWFSHIFQWFSQWFSHSFQWFSDIFPWSSHDFPSSTPVRMERKGAYYALVAAQESSEKADDAEDHQSLG